MTFSAISVPVIPAHLGPATNPAAAYAEMLPLIEAVADDQILPISADIPAVVSLVLLHAPQFQSLAELARAHLPLFEVAKLERLPTLALALMHAQVGYMTATAAETEDLGALQESGQALRARLLEDASYLSKRGVLDTRQLDMIRNLVGYRNLAVDLLALGKIFRDSWASIEHKSIVSAEDIGKAEEVGARILRALAAREQMAAAASQASVVRQKAYTLLVREYDEIRSAVAYLRWKQDDADTFAPSLFGGRRPSRRDKSAPATPATPASPVTPAEGLQAAPGPGLSPLAHTPIPPVPPGHQGGSPFIGE